MDAVLTAVAQPWDGMTSMSMIKDSGRITSLSFLHLTVPERSSRL
jgi:hypothetical protein